MATGPFFYYILWSDAGIQNILDKALPGLGYELVDLELTVQGDLRIFIDKEGGTTIGDCATVSNYLSRVFTAGDTDYKRLEVPSPGLDRPLKEIADFVRSAERQVKIKTRLSIGGQGNFVGRIENCKSGTVSISFNGKSVNIEFGNIGRAHPRPKLNF